MTKESTIERGLLADELVGVVDDIRRDIHGALGTRPWAIDIVNRSWSGQKRGVGVPTTRILRLDPTPRVERVTKDRMGPAGREAAGSVVLSEVSLRYSEAELQPSVATGNEIAYRLTELRGQKQVPKYYVLSAAPVPRRGDKVSDNTDWYILLHETSDMGDLDGVDA